MPVLYCYDVTGDTPEKTVLKNVTNLYIGPSEPKWPDKEAVNKVFFVTYIDNRACIRTKGGSKKNLARLEKIHSELSSGRLKKLGFGQPYEFKDESYDLSWMQEEGEKEVRPTLWTTLEHRGPYFAHLDEPYQTLGAVVTYDGKPYRLNPKEERVASYYVARLINEAAPDTKISDKYTHQDVYNHNFWEDWREVLTPKHKAIFLRFDKMSWGGSPNHLQEKIMLENARKKENKAKIAETRQRRVSEVSQRHGFAIVDGKRIMLKNSAVDLPGLFQGRGKQPKRGKVKHLIQPEDVILNLSKDTPIPPAPEGHKWGGVAHQPKAGWLSKWKDPLTQKWKYLMWGDSSEFKGSQDLKKFETARKLQSNIETVRKGYMDDAESGNSKDRQLGTVLWLIDRHGLRPGSDKEGKDEADTIGASTLRVGNVKVNKAKSEVTFDFLGKDSIQYLKTIKVPPVILRNFESLTEGKSAGESLFDDINAQDINRYLKQWDKSFTNKSFRTRLASCLMFEALNGRGISATAGRQEIKQNVNVANAEVAKVLNHQRAKTATSGKATEKLKAQIKEIRAKVKAGGKTDAQIAKLQKSLKAKEAKLKDKKVTSEVAIGTSLTNYIDPRIIVSWAEGQGDLQNDDELASKIEAAIYSKKLLEKFLWATTSTDKDWEWDKPSDSTLNPKEEEPSRPAREGSRQPPSDEQTQYKKAWQKLVRNKYGSKWYETDETTMRARKREAQKNARKYMYKGRNLKDWELLLQVCEEDKVVGSIRSLTTDDTNPYPALQWLYPYIEYLVTQKGVVKGSIADRMYRGSKSLLKR